MQKFSIEPIGIVSSNRTDTSDDFWGEVKATIKLNDRFPVESTLGLDSFSHIEVIYLFHKVAEEDVVLAAVHPRERKDWPRVGIFAQRKKNRPNRLGVSVCRLLKVDGRMLMVQGLDAINDSPIIDIKPYIREFHPTATEQPAWVSVLMKDYFSAEENI